MRRNRFGMRLAAAFGSLALLALCGPALAQFPGQEKIVSSELMALAEGAGEKAMSTGGVKSVRVIVTLTEPVIDAGQGERPLSTALPPAGEKALAVRSAQMSKTLMDVASPGLKVSAQMALLGSFAASVGPAELKRLAGNNQVAYIEPDHRYELNTKQGLALMGAAGLPRATGGKGVAIAIMDTGINYNHVALGGGGFPNKKVIGGYDFAGVLDLSDPKEPKPHPDADPLDPPSQSHGSWCASIAAGSLMPQGDYVGGVAPEAKLYALKVFGDNFPYTYDSWQLSAYEWILKNQRKDPNNPIMIVSMSLGGAMDDARNWPENGYCTSPAETEALKKLNRAGITVFVSSGNDARCTRVGNPACLRRNISVGAVSDVARTKLIGCVPRHTCIRPLSEDPRCSKVDRAFFSRQGGNRVGDVSYYSNSSKILDLLAPADNATCPGSKGPNDYTKSFAGTSAAAPYAAGAGAFIQSAVKRQTGRFLKPEELREALVKTGRPVTDWRNGITKPLIDLEKAVAYALKMAGGKKPSAPPAPAPTPAPAPKPAPKPTPAPAPKVKPAPAPAPKPAPAPDPAPAPAPKSGSGEKDITNQLFGN